jgi:hypothetical protein
MMNADALKEAIREELPALLRDDPQLRAFIADLRNSASSCSATPRMSKASTGPRTDHLGQPTLIEPRLVSQMPNRRFL